MCGAGQAGTAGGKCSFFLSRKGRTCRFDVVPGRDMCGMHLQADAKRVPCPLDPGHTVAKCELAAHLRICNGHKVHAQLQAAPYFRVGCNAGSGPGVLLGAETGGSAGAPAQDAGRGPAPAARRLAHARGMGEAHFLDLAARVAAASERLGGADAAPLEDLAGGAAQLPGERADAQRSAGNRPFSAKHARQQASIVGHLRALGLLEEAGARAYMEFGAGKGFLGLALAEAAPGAALVLVDSSAFRLCADRVLRKMQAAGAARFERLRVDIADFDPAGAPLLRRAPGAAGPDLKPWVALGKHLCGAATDLTLRCAARHAAGAVRRADAPSAAGPAGDARAGSLTTPAALCTDARDMDDRGTSGGAALVDGAPPSASAAAWSACAAADGFRAGGGGAGGALLGLAVATCCHHRCTWRDYVGQRFFLAAGFTPQEFEVVSWMCGWALCGHDAAPDAADAGSGDDASRDSMDRGRFGAGDAGSRDPAAAPPAAASPGVSGAGRGLAAGAVGTDPCSDEFALLPQRRGEPAQEPAALALHPCAGERACGGNASDIRCAGFEPHYVLSRAERVALGAAAKRLIDAGRLAYLRESGMRARAVQYVPPEVSGENRLLLATAGPV